MEDRVLSALSFKTLKTGFCFLECDTGKTTLSGQFYVTYITYPFNKCITECPTDVATVAHFAELTL